MYWLQAKVAEQQTKDWRKKCPPDPHFPIHPSTTFPKELRKHSPTSLRALSQLQSGTTPTDPYPSDPPGRCPCGQDRTSQHILLTCPNFQEARNDILPHAHLSIEFDTTQTAQTITFLRRVGLGFTQTLRDGIANDMSEEDLDVGRIASLALDLDI